MWSENCSKRTKREASLVAAKADRRFDGPPLITEKLWAHGELTNGKNVGAPARG